jgi:CRISPR/Cas system-associated endonuclease Cas3-HD
MSQQCSFCNNQLGTTPECFYCEETLAQKRAMWQEIDEDDSSINNYSRIKNNVNGNKTSLQLQEI